MPASADHDGQVRRWKGKHPHFGYFRTLFQLLLVAATPGFERSCA